MPGGSKSSEASAGSTSINRVQLRERGIARYL